MQRCGIDWRDCGNMLTCHRDEVRVHISLASILVGFKYLVIVRRCDVAKPVKELNGASQDRGASIQLVESWTSVSKHWV